jgi:hypothetical protein
MKAYASTVLAVVRAGAQSFRCGAALSDARAPHRAPELRARAAPRVDAPKRARPLLCTRRGAEDAVMYAVHAALLASGHALVGVGDSAKLEGAWWCRCSTLLPPP